MGMGALGPKTTTETDALFVKPGGAAPGGKLITSAEIKGGPSGLPPRPPPPPPPHDASESASAPSSNSRNFACRRTYPILAFGENNYCSGLFPFDRTGSAQ